MMTVYHWAPILLEAGSIVAPGNWGRILKIYGDQHSCWERERWLEMIRNMSFRDKPSRFEACFACPTLEIATAYGEMKAKKEGRPIFDVLYEAEVVDKALPLHRGDFNRVQPLPGTQIPANDYARYWLGFLDTRVVGYDNLQCEEIVTASPLRIVRRLA